MISVEVINNKTITDVPYFKASGIHIGLRKKEKKDLCVIYSEKKAVAAGVFTKNKVKAAPVIVDMNHIGSRNTQAIVVNSGYANSCTGSKGIEDAYEMARVTADCLGLKPEEVLVASTGRIGVSLPMDKVIPGIRCGCSELSYSGGKDAEEAILTTDTFTKSIFVELNIDNRKVYIGGIAKGSGMVHPNMGTILGFIASNINITKEMLTKALKDSVTDSYNMISVDGDTSTNDMAIVLANCTAGNNLIDQENSQYYKFKEALDFVNKELSKMIAKDGEGATKLIEISLKGARSKEDARICAKSVISSSLVKSAFFGSDANWGRIMCSLGYSGADFTPQKVDIVFKNNSGAIMVVNKGAAAIFNKQLVEEILKQDYVNILIDLNDGIHDAVAWGCDLTYDYVKINGYYWT
ncbi:bifunctional glutamate N-acetyltransferase/amino-acid acetyltransferase ArgJ [Clostridium sp. A1-XYC3]|uniref:Arginine biosynthesis bifunctional protein ArgJ n=1 Tax=Clostridium tanneri TaxID=3037988 RepID=A0ABU4JX47_9CLOT|nr:bifunctional glutamate N-acetyltransferase/amino-acid acetyltransferase ArgJ [Clostridium sp. A1-XYC3]MDW8802521.1 bifunctional glutamate N-acetyltransferase/amino-acid acetyltransferase ArgJ [Clostridium sp. A1-XYC3]